MTILITVLHVLVSLFLIVVVLLQQGKRADLAGAFGGGGSQTAFGTRGAATVLTKATTICAVLFMGTSIALSILLSRPSGGGGSVLGEVPAEQSAPAPLAGDDIDPFALTEDPGTAGAEEVPVEGLDSPAEDLEPATTDPESGAEDQN